MRGHAHVVAFFLACVLAAVGTELDAIRLLYKWSLPPSMSSVQADSCAIPKLLKFIITKAMKVKLGSEKVKKRHKAPPARSTGAPAKSAAPGPGPAPTPTAASAVSQRGVVTKDEDDLDDAVQEDGAYELDNGLSGPAIQGPEPVASRCEVDVDTYFRGLKQRKAKECTKQELSALYLYERVLVPSRARLHFPVMRGSCVLTLTCTRLGPLSTITGD